MPGRDDQPSGIALSWPAASRRRHRCVRRLAPLAVMVIAVLLPGRAAASVDNACPGPGLPSGSTSIQLFNFFPYVAGVELNDPLQVQQRRTEEVLRRLSAMGYRNVEPFSFQPQFSSGGLDARGFRSLLDRYRLAAPSAHVDMTPATFDQTLADARILGVRAVGSGGWPGLDQDGFSSYQEVLDTADTLNKLGARSVRNRTGKVFGHNHEQEFTTRFVNPATGEAKTVWELLVEHTNPRYVTFQLDVLWADDAGADPVGLLRRHGDRISLLHVKDGVGVDAPDPAVPVALGEGEVDLPSILRAGAGHVEQYIYEQDPPFGDPAYDPFAEAAKSLRYLQCVAL
jgi:sugar phosphate isomerase/epimerase